MKGIKIKDAVYRLIEKILPDKIFDFLWSKYYIWTVKRAGAEISDNAYYVRNKNGVKHPNYCIFRFSVGEGLFAVANKMLFYYEWAMANNYIPLADVEFKDDFTQGKFGLNNLWEHCFEQPEPLSEVFSKGNVFVSAINGGNVLRSTCRKINGDSNDWYVHTKTRDYREYYARLNQLSQKAWVFKPEVKEKIESAQKGLFHPGMRVLGVVLREEFGMDDSDMTEVQRALYKKHPKALSLEKTYELIVEYMTKWNCTHVLITTLFQESIEYFVDKLGSKVIFIERKRKNLNEYKQETAKTLEEIANSNGEKHKEAYKHIDCSKQTLEEITISYAVEMAAIAKCDYCMGVKCSGLIAACILNGGAFKDLYIFEDKNNIARY